MSQSPALLAISQAAASPLAAPAASHTLLVLAALVSCGIVCVAALLFVMLLKFRLQSLASHVVLRDAAIANVAAELEAQALLARQMSMDLEELRKRLLNQDEMSKPGMPLWASSTVAVNLNRRGQILRLSRKGKSVAEIAQDLNVAQGEVELLLKVHDLGQPSPKEKNSNLPS